MRFVPLLPAFHMTHHPSHKPGLQNNTMHSRSFPAVTSRKWLCCKSSYVDWQWWHGYGTRQWSTIYASSACQVLWHTLRAILRTDWHTTLNRDPSILCHFYYYLHSHKYVLLWVTQTLYWHAWQSSSVVYTAAAAVLHSSNRLKDDLVEGILFPRVFEISFIILTLSSLPDIYGLSRLLLLLCYIPPAVCSFIDTTLWDLYFFTTTTKKYAYLTIINLS